MTPVLKTNDPVKLSFAEALLKDAGIDAIVFDAHASAVDGSLGILPRRLMVIEEDATRARALLKDADLHDG